MSAWAEAAGSASGDGLILFEARGDVAVLRLNRPDKMNALDGPMVAALHAALDTLEAHADGVAVVVLTSADGRAFVAGADIAALRARGSDDALAAINSRLFDRVANLPMPTIAAVRGFALGGGCELAIACDLRVAGRSARFGQPEVGLGIMAAAGGTYRLPALVGLGRARELLFTGRIIDAAEALAIGLCERVVDDDEVENQAFSLAERIARNDRLAVQSTKAALHRVTHGGPVAIAAESALQAVLFASPEKARRMDAFLAKTAAKKDNI
jgi:enoyl-CoA hydratase